MAVRTFELRVAERAVAVLRALADAWPQGAAPTPHEVPDAFFDQLVAANRHGGRAVDFLVRGDTARAHSQGTRTDGTVYGWTCVAAMEELNRRFENTGARREGYAPGGSRFQEAQAHFEAVNGSAKRARHE